MGGSTKFLKYARMTGTIVQIIYNKVWCLGVGPFQKGAFGCNIIREEIDSNESKWFLLIAQKV